MRSSGMSSKAAGNLAAKRNMTDHVQLTRLYIGPPAPSQQHQERRKVRDWHRSFKVISESVVDQNKAQLSYRYSSKLGDL